MPFPASIIRAKFWYLTVLILRMFFFKDVFSWYL